MHKWYGTLGWLMYGSGVAAAATFWFYLDGFPEGRIPYVTIGLPAIPFVVLGKYFFEKQRKATAPRRPAPRPRPS